MLVEALAAHKPVIATTFPHAVEVLSDGAGLLVPHHDAQAIGTALKRVLTEPDLVGGMHHQATRISQNSRWIVVAERYRTLAVTLLSRAPVPL
ncbi:glycosyltransferase [Dactylosporangium sp. NPDC000244]|uniref:glycosyltransferase n=1 Tax=Dactylosporangium sp. NPDC000244 TaxID=3154365 RepID=UPI00333434E2